jgi:hypothetical protein
MFGANCAPILHRHQHCLQTARRVIPHDRRYLGVPSGASNTISDPTVCSTQMVHLSYIKISTISTWTELLLEPRHLGVPSGVSKMISEPMVRLAPLCNYLAPTLALSPNGKKWDFTWSTSPRSTIRSVQNDFHVYGTSIEIVHLSCFKISTISEWTELSLEPRLREYHWVCPKWFMSGWCIPRKLCTYVAPTLTLSTNEKKWDSTWSMSP